MARRKQYDNRFKAQVAIEAIKNERTMAQIASDYEVHPNQVRQWKRQILEESPSYLRTDTRNQLPTTTAL